MHQDRQVHVVELVRVTRAISRSEEVRLHGDQPHRGLRSAAR